MIAGQVLSGDNEYQFKASYTKKDTTTGTPVLTYFAISVEFLHWILLGETDSSHQFDTL